MNALKILSTVIAASIPLLYFHGQAFHQGWLIYWGIPAGLFPIGMEEALINGFLAYSILALKYLILILAYLLAAVGALYNVHELSKLRWVNKLAVFFKTNKAKPQVVGHPAIALVLAKAVKLTLLIFSIVLFLILVFSVSEQVSNLGKENAKEKHQKLQQVNDKTNFLINGKKITGKVILCSTQHCGLLAGSHALVVPVNDNFQATWPLNNEPEN